jgi:hypothetical protein
LPVTKADTHQAEVNEKEHPIFYIFKYFREIVNDLSLKIHKRGAGIRKSSY